MDQDRHKKKRIKRRTFFSYFFAQWCPQISRVQQQAKWQLSKPPQLTPPTLFFLRSLLKGFSPLGMATHREPRHRPAQRPSLRRPTPGPATYTGGAAAWQIAAAAAAARDVRRRRLGKGQRSRRGAPSLAVAAAVLFGDLQRRRRRSPTCGRVPGTSSSPRVHPRVQPRVGRRRKRAVLSVALCRSARLLRAVCYAPWARP